LKVQQYFQYFDLTSYPTEIELPVDLIYGPHPQSEEFPDETQAVFAYSDNMQKRMWKVQEKARLTYLLSMSSSVRLKRSTRPSL
jgi:hypothetical protein